MRTAVIGAGIIGLATAAELLRRGHDVVVFDPEPANGASRAAAGMLAAITEIDWGQDALHGLMRTAAAEYPGFVSALATAVGHPVGHLTAGTLAVGVDAADRESLVRLAELQRADGRAVQRISGTAAREHEPALGPAVTTAMLVADDHQIDPRQVSAALLDLLGDRVRADRVVAVRGDAARGRGVVLASGQVIDADVVIVAAGLGSASIEGVPPAPVRPVWGDILRLRVPESQRPLLTRTVRALVRGRSVYLVPRADGTLVVGASVRESGVAGVQAGAVLALLRDAQTVLPAIDECEIVEMLARPRPGSPDAAPLLGEVAPGLIVSTGYDRHGILLAPLAARLGADLAEGRALDDELRQALDPLRFTAPEASRQTTSLTPPAVDALVGASAKGIR